MNQSRHSTAFGFRLCASLLVAAYSTGPRAEQPASPSQRPDPKMQELKDRVAWQRTMALRPKPLTGCFRATFPAVEWTVVECAPAPKRPIPKRPVLLKNWRPPTVLKQVVRSDRGLAVAGDGNDVVATAVGGPITSAEGSFDQTVDIQSVTSVLIDKQGVSHSAPGAYGLQINTDNFATSTACAHSKNTNCTGWLQFLFFNDDNGSLAQMEVWINNFGPKCPGQGSIPQLAGMPPGASWTNVGGDCEFYTGSTPLLPTQPITSLGQLRLRAEAVAGGSDAVTITLPDGSISGYALPDELLKPSATWQSVEFNVFGYVNGERAHFNQGAAAVVHLTVDNATTNAPLLSNAGFTGETNTFNLVLPGCASGGDPPSVVFEEVTLDNQKSLACPPVIPAPAPPPPPNACQEATELVEALQEQLAKAQARRQTPLCSGPASLECTKTAEADQAALSKAVAEKNQACKP